MFGAVSEQDYVGPCTITIGHVISGDRETSVARLNTDLLQIKLALEKKANFPSGVSLIRNDDGWDTVESESDSSKGRYWVTEIMFDITYALAAP
jgi:hypothetical protein